MSQPCRCPMVRDRLPCGGQAKPEKERPVVGNGVCYGCGHSIWCCRAAGEAKRSRGADL